MTRHTGGSARGGDAPAFEPGQQPRAVRRALLALGGSACLAAGLAGCDLRPRDEQAVVDPPRQVLPAVPPRVAWVFSSGGPRAFMHVGVVQALDELGLVPDIVVGSSGGSLVAVLRAAGLRGPALRELALDVQPLTLMRLAIGTPEWFSGARLAEWVRAEVGGRGLQQLEWPVACVAHRPADGRQVAFTSGDSGLAVWASCAIEGRIVPVTIGGDLYVDADLHQPLPVRIARRLGAQRVVAVDVSAHEDKAPEGTENWRAGDLRKRALTRPDAEAADLLLHPDAGYYAGLSREYREHAIDAGYRSALASAEQLRAVHTR